MATIIGSKDAKEISLCKQGKNRQAHVLLRKSVPATPPEPAPDQTLLPENTDMDVKIAKRIALMNDVTKSYFGGLEDDAVATAFLAKSAVEQDKEASDAKAAADARALEIEAEKSGKTTGELETKKALDAANQRIADLEKADKTRQADTEIEKKARSADFAGFPGGEEKLVPLLKSAAKLPDDERTAYEDVLKAQATMAKKAGSQIGLRTEEDVMKSAPTLFEVNKAAQERAQAAGTTVETELSKMADEPAWAAKVAKATNEEMAA
jgi:hypothetical protein